MPVIMFIYTIKIDGFTNFFGLIKYIGKFMAIGAF